MTLLTGDPRHGSQGAYNYHRCRCEICREQHNIRQAGKKRQRAGRALPNYDERHGSTAGYVAGCRCERCAEASRAYRAARRAGESVMGE